MTRFTKKNWNGFLTLYQFLGSDFGVGMSEKEVLIQGFGLASCSAGNEYPACGTAPGGKLQEILVSCHVFDPMRPEEFARNATKVVKC